MSIEGSLMVLTNLDYMFLEILNVHLFTLKSIILYGIKVFLLGRISLLILVLVEVLSTLKIIH